MQRLTPWTISDIPPQRGRLAVITGATGGLGYETALALAGAGAQVVLTGRDPGKGSAALAAVRAVHPGAAVSYETLDLGSLASVRDFSARLRRAHGALDILVNNGGVMAPPTRQATHDGFELQFGTNYLSHFALTAQLLPLLAQGRQARVVNLSSLAHRQRSAIDFDDLNWQRRYTAYAAYSQSKLAMLMFSFELQRRSNLHGWRLLSVAAHPGVARTQLLSNGQRLVSRRKADLLEALSRWLPSRLVPSASQGALPILYAATSADAEAASSYGPTGFQEIMGRVGKARVAPGARDQAAAARLWAASESLTGVQWPAVPSTGAVAGQRQAIAAAPPGPQGAGNADRPGGSVKHAGAE
jgi:NAD(P)-dependent dehydrogenase (short-subunit alcohol dehydrogenase family)